MELKETPFFLSPYSLSRNPFNGIESDILRPPFRLERPRGIHSMELKEEYRKAEVFPTYRHRNPFNGIERQ